MRFNFTILKIQRYKLSKKDTNYLKKDTNYLKINLFLSKIHNLEQLHISIFKLFDDLKISQLIIKLKFDTKITLQVKNLK